MKVSPSIINPQVAVSILNDHMRSLDHEEVWAVFLDQKARVIDQQMLSKGTLTKTAIDNRTVLRNALLLNATAVILLHNHPSGDPRPSQQDIQFTEQLKKACSLMDIKLLDHIVISENGFFSFASEIITQF